MKKTLIIINCILIGLLAPFNVFALEKPSVKQHYLKIMYDGKVIFHEKVFDETKIQVFNTDDEIVKSDIIRKEEEIELDKPTLPKGYILSYWNIEVEDDITIVPVLIEASSMKVTFISLEGGELISNNAQTKFITKSVDEGTLFKDVVPETNPGKNNKLSGWFVKKNGQFEAIETEKMKVTKDAEYYALFYPDLNDNNIDDRTEKITVKLNYNIDKKTDEHILSVGERVKLPKLERKGYIFTGWYYDEEFKEKYNHLPFLDDTTLFAKWEKAEKIVEESKENPITEKDISDQVEKYLNERLDLIENSGKSKNSKGTGNRKEKDLIIQENDNPQMDYEEETIEVGNDTAKDVLIYTEKKFVYKNDNQKEEYMIKILDENDKFLFSMILPYGRTIQILHENESVNAEYAVRQPTTINVNVQEIITNDAEFLKLDSKTRKVNDSYITLVYPKVNHFEPKNVSVLDEKTEKTSYFENVKIIGYSVALIVLIALFVIYFILKRKKGNNEAVSK